MAEHPGSRVAPEATAHVIVMARYPAPGRVKTRLAAALGEETACALYRAFVLDLAERLRGQPLPVTWAYWPPDAPFATLLSDARCRPQQGRDLGERMAAAIGAELADGAAAAIVIGADVPHVALAEVAEAVCALAAGADLVLGPAHDGGYYLIGVRTPRPGLFQGIVWGTATVLAASIERARALRLRTRLLAPGFDLDGPADLGALAALIADGDVRLPRTGALLARAGIRGLRNPPGATVAVDPWPGLWQRGPVMDYAATCQYCGETIVKGETIRPEDLQPLADHLQTRHPHEVVGVRTWKMTEVLRHYRVATV